MQGKWTRLVRPTIQFFLVAFALYVGYTRVSDYKHHWGDVLIGLLQGALIAVLTVSFEIWILYIIRQKYLPRKIRPWWFVVEMVSFGSNRTELLHTSFSAFVQVRYVSDFFKQRPPPCTRTDSAEVEQLERKQNPQASDAQHRNHYSYSGPVWVRSSRATTGSPRTH